MINLFTKAVAIIGVIVVLVALGLHECYKLMLPNKLKRIV